ncbi:MAG: PorV/PorQ family protein [Elusimicrobiota bacterium]
MMRHRLLLAAVMLLAAGMPAQAISKNAGTSGSQFLKLGAGSRAGGMGEAFSAVADDIHAVYYNPAGLTRITGSQLAASHTELFQDINYEFAAFAYALGRAEDHSKHVLAASIYSLQVSGIERRAEDTNNPIGNFNAGDYSYNISYGHWLNPSVSLGITGKLISQRIDSYSSEAFAIDGGLQYRPRPAMQRPLTLSLVIKNLGSQPKFAGISDPLPMAFVAGVGYEIMPKRFIIDIDATKYRDTDAFFGIGGEFRQELRDDIGFALRAGVNTHRTSNEGLTEVTAGAGINFHRAAFDFSWVPFGVLGNTFRYSLILKF